MKFNMRVLQFRSSQEKISQLEDLSAQLQVAVAHIRCQIRIMPSGQEQNLGFIKTFEEQLEWESHLVQ